jgi:hypothetical protein
MRRVVQTLPTGEGETSEPEEEGGGPVADRPAPAPPPARPEPLRTEFDFELPRGYVDPSGMLYKSGTMRLATARDELLPLHDDRVRENPAYLTVVLLARVITRLGSLEGDDVRANVIENLFASDLAFLQDLYRRINTEGHTKAAVTCPACHERFTVDLAGGRPGEA